MSNKVYVDVQASFTKEGVLTPMQKRVICIMRVRIAGLWNGSKKETQLW